MDIQYIPRVAFDLRYDFILNFNQVYRDLLGPFVRLASNISISNENKLGESLQFEIQEDKIRIDVGPEKLSLYTEGKMPIPCFKNSQSSGRIFLEILNKLRKLETFGNLRHYSFLMEVLVEIKGTRQEIIRKLQDSFILPSVRNFSGDANSFKVVFGSKEDDVEQILHLGYFDETLLSNAKDLHVFSSAKMFELFSLKAKGLIISFQLIAHGASNIDLRLLKKLTEDGSTKIQNLINDGNLQ